MRKLRHNTVRNCLFAIERDHAITVENDRRLIRGSVSKINTKYTSVWPDFWDARGDISSKIRSKLLDYLTTSTQKNPRIPLPVVKISAGSCAPLINPQHTIAVNHASPKISIVFKFGYEFSTALSHYDSKLSESLAHRFAYEGNSTSWSARSCASPWGFGRNIAYHVRRTNKRPKFFDVVTIFGSELKDDRAIYDSAIGHQKSYPVGRFWSDGGECLSIYRKSLASGIVVNAIFNGDVPDAFATYPVFGCDLSCGKAALKASRDLSPFIRANPPTPVAPIRGAGYASISHRRNSPSVIGQSRQAPGRAKRLANLPHLAAA